MTNYTTMSHTRYTTKVSYYLICPIGVIAGPQDELTYSSESELLPGQIIKIPFGRLSKLGIVTSQTVQPSFQAKPIEQPLDVIVPPHLIELARWISEYYATRLSFVLQTMLPAGITKKRRVLKANSDKTVSRDS